MRHMPSSKAATCPAGCRGRPLAVTDRRALAGRQRDRGRVRDREHHLDLLRAAADERSAGPAAEHLRAAVPGRARGRARPARPPSEPSDLRAHESPPRRRVPVYLLRGAARGADGGSGLCLVLEACLAPDCQRVMCS